MTSRKAADVTLRPTRSAYIAPAAILGVPLLICLLATLKNPSFWPACAALGGLVGFLYLWISGFEINLAGGELTYRTRFGGTRSVPVDRIATYRYERGYVSQDKPIHRLVLKQSQGDELMVINAKVFGVDDLSSLLAALGEQGELVQ